ncbi:ArnT family glycosyltransferase [Robiginitalea myxolifaciens]|uniref:ArnT family glycosyltransferase n=1 Tax=Robiginitalea myxolifaciens TaxID=400055 RepID=UPI001C432AD4|nr:glycosyltransferase family 39 protein [Robiginitalea myxolifaciens]
MLLIIPGALLGLNLLQAGQTELLFDEAYYWYYAQHPAWGYFDHPPMVAWMITLGGLLFKAELGTRLIACLMGIGTLALIWSMIGHPKKKEYIPQISVWLLSIVLLHAYGFLSLPDTPLIFFTALFLWVYRKFLDRPGGLTALGLGLTMAALMYSKYHGALVILFVLFSNLSLLKNRWAWLALGISLLAYAPHLNWLYQQDFISVEYHLFERPNQPYSFTKFTLGYLVNLLALFGLTFPLVYWGLWRYKPADQWGKALRTLTWGILIFFFISSLQRRVQTQWLIAVCIPAAIIIGNQLLENATMRKWIVRAGIANLLILGYLRIWLVVPAALPLYFETHGNKNWVAEVDTVADGAKVIFENSYRQAAMYQFYSGNPSYSLNNAFYRKNQYSIDNSEAVFQGERVFLSLTGPLPETPFAYKNGKGDTKYGQFIEALNSYRQLKAGVIHERNTASEIDGIKAGEIARFWVLNTYDQPVSLGDLQFGIAYMDAYKKTEQIQPLKPVLPDAAGAQLQPGDTLYFGFSLPEQWAEDQAYLRAVLRQKELPWGLNGDPQELIRD